eukprot:355471-Chlamydomonas_euryale.AAC.9
MNVSTRCAPPPPPPLGAAGTCTDDADGVAARGSMRAPSKNSSCFSRDRTMRSYVGSKLTGFPDRLSARSAGSAASTSSAAGRSSMSLLLRSRLMRPQPSTAGRGNVRMWLKERPACCRDLHWKAASALVSLRVSAEEVWSVGVGRGRRGGEGYTCGGRNGSRPLTTRVSCLTRTALLSFTQSGDRDPHGRPHPCMSLSMFSRNHACTHVMTPAGVYDGTCTRLEAVDIYVHACIMSQFSTLDSCSPIGPSMQIPQMCEFGKGGRKRLKLIAGNCELAHPWRERFRPWQLRDVIVSQVDTCYRFEARQFCSKARKRASE